MITFFTVLSVFVLIGCSAFFSGSETALTASSKSRMHILAEEGDWRAKVVSFLMEKSDRLIGTLLLGNNLVNILASAIATKLMIDFFGDSGVVWATLVMTMLVLIFAEVLPKTYALYNSDKMALAIAPIIRIFVIVFAPITALIGIIVKMILHVFGATFEWQHVSGTLEELRGAIALHQGQEGREDHVKHERAMLSSILDLADITVEEIMTHRSNVEMIDADQPTSAIIDQALSSPYSRLPIYQDNPDNIVGVIHSKLLMRQIRDHRQNMEDIDIIPLLSEPWFIPETTKLFQQLQMFRERKEHFAVVVDEYGALQGVVTLEDILEEIVGEIEDEVDVTPPDIAKDENGGGYVVDGMATIRDLNRQFDWALPDENYSTIAGLVIHEAKAIPTVGQQFAFYRFRFEVLERSKNQLTSLRVTPLIDS